jgi:hypothetical protein
MYLNTNKAMDLIYSLEMVKGNNDIFNNYELKFLREQEGTRQINNKTV